MSTVPVPLIVKFAPCATVIVSLLLLVILLLLRSIVILLPAGTVISSFISFISFTVAPSLAASIAPARVLKHCSSIEATASAGSVFLTTVPSVFKTYPSAMYALTSPENVPPLIAFFLVETSPLNFPPKISIFDPFAETAVGPEIFPFLIVIVLIELPQIAVI